MNLTLVIITGSVNLGSFHIGSFQNFWVVLGRFLEILGVVPRFLGRYLGRSQILGR